MESGERKNIQARQSSDGSFELFVGQGGLEEISEEVSFAETIAPSLGPIKKQKNTKTTPIIVATLLILAVAVGGILLLKGGTKKKDPALTEVQGFRAYRGNAPAKKRTVRPKIKKKSPAKIVEKIEKTEDVENEENNVAWKLTGTEPTPPNDTEARIQPNRNPSPESIDIVIHDDENVIDDENDDSREIAAQKRLGFLPTTKIPVINTQTLPNIKSLKPRLIGKDLPRFGGIPKIQPTSRSTETDRTD